MTTLEPSGCPNCGEPRSGRFCAACGQDNRHAQLRLAHALVDVLEVSLGVEGRIWRTVAGLTTAPGRLVAAYLDGRRAAYVHPFRYACTTCAIWWGVLNLVLARLDLSGADPRTLDLLRYGNWLNLLIVPLLAIPIWLVFLGSRRSLLEHCYTMLFASGQVFLWRAALSAIGPLLPSAWAGKVNRVEGYAAVAFVLWTLWGVHRGRVTWLWVRLSLAVLALVYGTQQLVGLAGLMLLG